MEKIIQYFGQAMKVNCDENCNKAWGISNRPKIQLSEDENDYAYLADNEVGLAPEDPETYEGGHAKPLNKQGIPNKWCVRECERCNRSSPGESNLPLEVKSFAGRRYNISRQPN